MSLFKKLILSSLVLLIVFFVFVPQKSFAIDYKINSKIKIDTDLDKKHDDAPTDACYNGQVEIKVTGANGWSKNYSWLSQTDCLGSSLTKDRLVRMDSSGGTGLGKSFYRVKLIRPSNYDINYVRLYILPHGPKLPPITASKNVNVPKGDKEVAFGLKPPSTREQTLTFSGYVFVDNGAGNNAGNGKKDTDEKCYKGQYTVQAQTPAPIVSKTVTGKEDCSGTYSLSKITTNEVSLRLYLPTGYTATKLNYRFNHLGDITDQVKSGASISLGNSSPVNFGIEQKNNTCNSNPGLQIIPVQNEGKKGEPKEYVVRVTNNDKGKDCDDKDKFTIKIDGDTPSGWNASLNKNELAVEKGGKHEDTKLTIRSSQVANPGVIKIFHVQIQRKSGGEKITRQARYKVRKDDGKPTPTPTRKPKPSKSPTPTPRPTGRPTPTPTRGPSPTPRPSGSPTLTPTVRPTATPTPHNDPTPTPNPEPGEITIDLEIGLDGIGTTSRIPLGGNKNPEEKDRALNFHLYKTADNSHAFSWQESVTYDETLEKFTALMSLPKPDKTDIADGNYNFYVSGEPFLTRRYTGSINLTADQTTTIKLETFNLITGNITNNGGSDNRIDQLDYHVLLSCSIYSQDEETCEKDQNYKENSDLNSDGIVNEDDFTLWLKETINQEGDSPPGEPTPTPTPSTTVTPTPTRTPTPSPTACNRVTPEMTITQDKTFVKPGGGKITYTVKIKNVDQGPCEDRNMNLTRDLRNENWIGDWDPNRTIVDFKKGQTRTKKLAVTSPNQAPVGTYDVTVNLRNNENQVVVTKVVNFVIRNN